MLKRYLLAPGPTPVPSESLLAMAEPMWHHRTPRFRKLYQEVTEGLKYAMQTSQDVYCLASAGTGAMEAAVANLMGKDEKALVVRGGKFGERWGEICQAYGVPFEPIDVTWGEGVKPEQIAAKAKADPSISAVFLTLCETSTATHTDVKAVAAALAGTKAMVVVDGISAVGAQEYRMDEWCIDATIVGSQKALMTPPGMAYIALSARAQKKMTETSRPRYYFDLRKYKKSLDKWDPPFTPPVTLFAAQGESLKIIRQTGIETIWARTAKFGAATRAAVEAMGLRVFSKAPSNCVTAILMPEGVDGEAVVKEMRDVSGVTPAGGQDQLKGKVVRLTHMGYIDQFDIMIGLTALADALAKFGQKTDLGKGVDAYRRVLGS